LFNQKFRRTREFKKEPRKQEIIRITPIIQQPQILSNQVLHSLSKFHVPGLLLIHPQQGFNSEIEERPAEERKIVRVIRVCASLILSYNKLR